MNGLDYPKTTPRSYLPLSAAPDLLPEDARSAEVIERLLADDSEAGTDRLIDYVWADATESELRAAWGDR